MFVNLSHNGVDFMIKRKGCVESLKECNMKSVIVDTKPVIKVKGCPVGHSDRTMWCGPYALALVSGMEYDEVYKKALRKVRSMKAQYEHKPTYIKGMYNRELEAVSTTLKVPFTFKKIEGLWRKKDQLTLKRAIEYLRPNRVYVVQVTEHFLVVNSRDWTMCDNWTRGWVPLEGSIHTKKKVAKIAEVKRHKVF